MNEDARAAEDTVLLLNTREDKGFGLILAVAALCPGRRFVCVASQTDPAEAERTIAAHGLVNVRILPRTDDVDSLYAAARIVAVPSFRFRETFSRVCIEAQRHGTPVIGSDQGNLPYLLAASGISLSEDAALWAAEIERLFADDAYHASRRRLALENSERYSAREQRRDILQIVADSRSPVAVAIGSGLGNLIHTGPLIRRLSEHFGHRLDLIVAEDYDNSLSLLHDPALVGSVFSLRGHVLDRRWRLIFVTHSFGFNRPRFASDEIVWCRDWDVFHPDHALHEAIFNLESARQQLGVAYEPADAARAILNVGDETVAPEARLVGLHGGSKGGVWASKRWPGYPDLAAALIEDGFLVASFGLASEYIPGTLDLTGGSIEDMARAMRRCAAFVANDSGVMNVANALGIPVLALFAPTNWRTRGPLGPAAVSLALDKPCSPCEVLDPPLFRSGACRCIEELPLPRVLAAFRDLWARRAAPTPANGTPWRG